MFAKNVFPDLEKVFQAIKLCPLEKVKVVILGQDPYHEKGQANGLAFSVNDNVKLPPSLKNIYKELEFDLNIPTSNWNGDLSKWANQGVLLLNTTLTVEEGKANSHNGVGWKQITKDIIKSINDVDRPIVFLLWGDNARQYRELLNNSKHFYIISPHPSPLSAYRGFFGSKPFSKTNDFLLKNNVTPIDWNLNND